MEGIIAPSCKVAAFLVPDILHVLLGDDRVDLIASYILPRGECRLVGLGAGCIPRGLRV